MKRNLTAKHILIFIILTAMLLCVGGCNNNTTVPNEIELSLKKDTLTPTGITLIITNNSSTYDFVYGADYGIETYTNEQWQEVPALNDHVVFTIAYIIHPNSSKDFKIDWNYIYGELPQGDYRIVKKFNKVEAFDDISDVITSQELYYYFSID